MSPRWFTTQAAISFACSLAVSGCRVGESRAIPPSNEGANLSHSDAAIKAQEPDAASSVDAPSLDASSLPPNDAEARAADAHAGDGSCGPSCAPPSGCNAQAYGGHRYFFCSDSVTWDDARARCLGAGADLVIIDDAAENTFVAAQMSATSWIGANDRDMEGSWVWVVPGEQAKLSGAMVSYSHWGSTKPDNCGGIFGQQDCARIAKDESWDDSDCMGGCLEGTFAFVCETR